MFELLESQFPFSDKHCLESIKIINIKMEIQNDITKMLKQGR